MIFSENRIPLFRIMLEVSAFRRAAGVIAGRGFLSAGNSMNSVFVARGTTDAIPIWFVTAANWPDVRERLDAGARAFAEAAGFEADLIAPRPPDAANGRP